MPHISSLPLDDIAKLLGVDAQGLSNVAVIKELAEKAFSKPLTPEEDRIYTLLNMLRKTCWIEEDVLNCMDLYDNTLSGRPVFAATATPPPGFPPWWEKIEIQPYKKPKAFIFDDAAFVYPQYEGAQLLLWLISRRYPDSRIAVFAISSLRRILETNLPPGVGLYQGLIDAWGKMRVGVDLPEYDIAVVFWPSLHISARRRLRAAGRDPDAIELMQAIQLAGRILRPRPGETHEDVLAKRLVIFADARFSRPKKYLTRYFEVEDYD